MKEAAEVDLWVDVLVADVPEMLFESCDLDEREVVFDEVDLVDDFAEDEVRVEVLSRGSWEQFVEHPALLEQFLGQSHGCRRG